MSSEQWEALGTCAAVVVAVGALVYSWWQSRSGTARVARAEARADEALDLAKAADARADRLETLQTERSDVAWRVEEDVTGREWLTLMNVGADTAHDVEIVLTDVNGNRIKHEHPSTGPGATIAVDTRTWADAARARWQDNLSNNVFGTGGYDVHLRVVWRTEAGAFKSHTADLRL